MSSAAFAVSASASGGVTPSASAFASSLRTRSSRALGGSECISNLQVDLVELSIEPYSHHTTFPRGHAAAHITRIRALYTRGYDRSDLAERPVRGLRPARRRGR